MNHCRILVGLLLGMCVLATGCAESPENGAGADSRKVLRRGNGSEPAALDPALASQPGRSRLHIPTARQSALVGRKSRRCGGLRQIVAASCVADHGFAVQLPSAATAEFRRHPVADPVAEFNRYRAIAKSDT